MGRHGPGFSRVRPRPGRRGAGADGGGRRRRMPASGAGTAGNNGTAARRRMRPSRTRTVTRSRRTPRPFIITARSSSAARTRTSRKTRGSRCSTAGAVTARSACPAMKPGTWGTEDIAPLSLEEITAEDAQKLAADHSQPASPRRRTRARATSARPRVHDSARGRQLGEACPNSAPRPRRRPRGMFRTTRNFPMPDQLTARVFVVGDNIDTDQIIPAQYLTLLPTVPEEYAQLGSFALIGLPDDVSPVKFVPPGEQEDAVWHRRCRTQLRLRLLARTRAHRARRGGVPRGHRGELRAHLSSATASPRARCTRMNRWTGSAACSKPATR